MRVADVPPLDLGELSPNTWDALASDRFYSSSSWLRLCATTPGATSTGVVIARDDGARVLAAAPVTVVEGPPSAFYRWNELMAGHGLPQPPATGLMIGADQGYQSDFLYGPEVERAKAAEALTAELTARHQALPGADQQALVGMYLSTDTARAISDSADCPPPVFLETEGWWEMPEGGWEEYLENHSYKRRVAIRAEVRRFAEAGYTVEHLPLAECCDIIARLAAVTQNKYGHSGSEEKELTAFQRHAAVMGDKASVAVCRLPTGEAVGFCLSYVWGDTLYLRAAGFDYERLVGAAEYFNVVIYGQIMRAPELGVRNLHAGIKAPEAKALRGAALRPLWFVDLSPQSVLHGHDAEIRAHNAAALDRLTADRRTASRVSDRESWLGFC
ncbi:GNAT family N-acetyltransferase [Streptomyces parvus]|uniref:GNAT family N-acetyltransferase n=1 Tax=Streptomyces parvus TaxID=66428 RepID=UPI0033BBCB5E